MDASFGAVVYRMRGEPEYLLVHHAGPGHWDFPKGHPDKGETPEETALREVLEETNCTVSIKPGFSERIEYVLPAGIPKEVTFFLAEYNGAGDHRIDPEEISATGWFTFMDAVARITFENSRRVIDCADAFLRREKVI